MESIGAHKYEPYYRTRKTIRKNKDFRLVTFTEWKQTLGISDKGNTLCKDFQNREDFGLDFYTPRLSLSINIKVSYYIKVHHAIAYSSIPNFIMLHRCKQKIKDMEMVISWDACILSPNTQVYKCFNKSFKNAPKGFVFLFPLRLFQ